jgi:hypothetical protein
MSSVQVHGGGSTQLFEGTPDGEPAMFEIPIPVDPSVTEALDKMLNGLRAGIAMMVPEWGGRTWDELEQALVLWQRATRIFQGKFDVGWRSVHEMAIHPKNGARSLQLYATYPAWVDGNMTERRLYPQSYAVKIGNDGRGLAQAIRSIIESTLVP